MSTDLFYHGILTPQQLKRELSILNTVEKVSTQGPFEPSWESLLHFQAPRWYSDAKFGIFIHWGVYSVPAFENEWYARQMYGGTKEAYEHHLATFGPTYRFGYKDFIPMFKAEHFDPDGWMRLFRDAGARYVIAVAEHHDGFSMYDNSLSDWNAVKMGPHRDIVAALAKSAGKAGLKFGLSSHRAEHWWFYDTGRGNPNDTQDPRNASLYGPAEPYESTADASHLDNWLARSAELVDKYHPQIMFFDWWVERPEFQPYLQKFAAFYYNRGAQRKENVAVAYKNIKFIGMPDGAGVLDVERGQIDKIRPWLWQTDTSVSRKSWGYIEGDTYKPAAEIVQNLVDIVSKNGVLLLNIGPKSDGTIPTEVQGILHEVGTWLHINGEAIYGTRAWTTFGEGPTAAVSGNMTEAKQQAYTGSDFRFTTKGETLYAFALARPAGTNTIHSLGTGSVHQISSVSLLGYSKSVDFQQTADGLTINLPDDAAVEPVYVFAIRGALKT